MAVNDAAEALLNSLIAGGSSWRFQKRMVINAASRTTTHQAYTLLDITGGGVFVGIDNDYGGNITFAVQIDGGAIFNFTSRDITSAAFLIPFQQSLKVTTSFYQELTAAHYVATAVLVSGDKWSQWALVTSAPSAANLTTTLLDVIGSGVLMGVHSVGPLAGPLTIEVDNGTRRFRMESLGGTTQARKGFFIPFKQRLRITTSDTNLTGNLFPYVVLDG